MPLPGFRINEVFRSIQGEGAFTGRPATFIRFQGCNLRCEFCDTPKAQDPDPQGLLDPPLDATMDEVVHLIRKIVRQGDLIIFTGGEPCLQPIGQLASAIRQEDMTRQIHLETNGTVPIPTNMDWVTVSPKPRTKVFACAVQMADEVKCLVQDEWSITDVLEMIRACCLNHSKIALQPISQDKMATQVAYAACLKHGFRLSIQVHKYIEVE